LVFYAFSILVGMDFILIVLMALAVGAAGFLVGKTGWGGWVVAGGVAWILFSPVVVIGISQPVSAALDLALIIWSVGKMKGKVIWRDVFVILLPCVPGALLGVSLVSVFDTTILSLLAALLILAAVFPAVWKLAELFLARVGLGFFSGILSSLGLFNGPPIALALSGEKKQRRLSGNYQCDLYGYYSHFFTNAPLPSFG
jgi:uncharacterized membrane protein YfcA